MGRRRYHRNPITDDILEPVIFVGVALLVYFNWTPISNFFSGALAAGGAPASGGGVPGGATNTQGTINQVSHAIAADIPIPGFTGGTNPTTDQGFSFPTGGGTVPITGNNQAAGAVGMPPLVPFQGF